MCIWSAAFSPDGRFLISASGNPSTQELGACILWDLALGRELAEFQPPKDVGCITDIAYSPDGALVALAAVERGVWLCDAATGREVRRFQGKRFHRVAFDRTGRRLAAGSADLSRHDSNDGWVFVWDVATGTELSRWQAHNGLVTALVFSADGDRLLSASYNEMATRGELKIWDPVTGREVLRLPGYLHVALSDDGRRLAAMADRDVSGPGIVTVWDAAPAGR